MARRTCKVRDEYGQLEEIVAGQTFVHDKRHYLIREYPDLWAPDSEASKLTAPTRNRSRAWTL